MKEKEIKEQPGKIYITGFFGYPMRYVTKDVKTLHNTKDIHGLPIQIEQEREHLNLVGISYIIYVNRLM